MSQTRTRRRRRSWPRTILLLVFVAATLVGVYHCLFRKPEIDPLPAVSSEAQSAQDSVSADPQPVLERKPEFYTILISGVDDGNGNSDTNILVGFDAGTGAIHGVSIPRDTGVNVSRKVKKINAAYGIGGTEELAKEVSDMLGIPVDFTVQVNLKGFVKLVNAIEGVDFEVPINMNYDDPLQGLSIHFQKGMQHLNGQDALKVVRFRHNNDGSGYGTEDIGRIGTQQAFLKAVAKKALSHPEKISDYVKIFQEYVDTDLELSELAWLGQKAVLIGIDHIEFSTLPGAWSDSRSLYMLDSETVLELVNTSLNPYTEDRTLSDLNLLT